MRDEFSSKIYIEQESNNIGMRILFLFIGIIVIGAVLIKLIVGDFKISDITGILFYFILINVMKSRIPPKYVYAHGQCIIDYDKEKMTITYPNMNTGKRGTFKDVNVIRYDDIENIQFGKELGCFRIVARGERIREYLETGKKAQMATIDKMEETYIYVLEEEEQDQLMRNLQRKAGFIITVLEKND